MDLTIRQKLTIKILLFIVKLLDPTKYTHETDKFITEIKEELK
jgi:hypothetical protein